MSEVVAERVDPLGFRLCEPRWFEDFRVGEAFYIPSRTMTDALFASFQAASGDNHPIHYDRHYCRANGHRDLLAHGFQVLIQTAIGAGVLPHMMGPSLVGFLEQSCRFLKGVYAGDTVYPRVVVAKLEQQRSTGVMTCDVTVHNQDGDLVLEGWHRYLLRRRPERPS
ncbi:MaoC family dehydratase [Acuticoccus sp.]|uniref:MaoC family dehydratase n=1 Tax=Acuticoccus sp. TaxID=1904378 RepID=UPI003B51F8A4